MKQPSYEANVDLRNILGVKKSFLLVLKAPDEKYIWYTISLFSWLCSAILFEKWNYEIFLGILVSFHSIVPSLMENSLRISFWKVSDYFQNPVHG